MTLVQWYKSAMALPYIVTLIACTIAALDFHSPTTFVGTMMIVGGAGIVAFVPYTLFLILVLVFVKPRSVVAYRRTALLAPILIAIPFAIAMAAGLDSVTMVSGVALYGVAALIVGYFYVVLVETGALIVRRLSRTKPAAARRIAQ